MPLTQLQSLKTPNHAVNIVAEVGTSGALVIASSRFVTVWFPQTRKYEWVIKWQEREVANLAVFDESTLLTMNSDGWAEIFRIHGGEMMGSVFYLDYVFTSCAALDSTCAVAGTENGHLAKMLWKDGQLSAERNIIAHNECIYGISVHKGRFCTSSKDSTAKMWDCKTLELIHTFRGHKCGVNVVDFDDNYVVTASFDWTMRVYDARSFEFIKCISVDSWSKSSIRTVLLVKNKNITVSVNSDSYIALHRLPDGEFISIYRSELKIKSIKLLASGRIAIGGEDPCGVIVLEFEELNNESSSKKMTSEGKRQRGYENRVKEPLESRSVKRVKITMSHNIDNQTGNVANNETPPFDFENNSSGQKELVDEKEGNDESKNLSGKQRVGRKSENLSNVKQENEIEETTETKDNRNIESNMEEHFAEKDAREKAAVQHFRGVIQKSGRNKKTLRIDVATEALNEVLKSEGCKHNVTVDQLEDILVQISEELEVCEEDLVKIYGEVRDWEKLLKREYNVIFDRYIRRRDKTKIAFASRVLRHGCKDLKERGLLGDKALIEQDVILELMSKFDGDNDGKVNRKEFVDAALSIVHGIEREEVES